MSAGLCLIRVFTAAVVFAASVAGQDSVCGGESSGAPCLQLLKDVLTRKNWWFGDSYSSACSSKDTGQNLACMNPDTEHTTIISRTFQTPTFDLNNVTQVLRIRFYVAGGSYRACGHPFDVPAAFMTQDVNFSQLIYLDSWSLQHRPALLWEPEPGVSYSLLAYNVDLMDLAGLWVNIQGGDSALGDELFPYQGPLSALDRNSFLVFLLFKQTDLIGDWRYDVIRASLLQNDSSPVFNLDRLLDQVEQIDQLVGVGLINFGADPHAINKLRSRGLYNNCPWLIGRMRPLLKTVLGVHNLTSLGADVTNLETELEVRYTSEAVQYRSCCKNVTESRKTFQVDPLSLSPIGPVLLRSQPFIRLAAVNMLDPLFFFDKLYTILLLDVTWATSNPASRQTSLLWQVTDVTGQYVTSGVTQKNYTMPLPPLTRSGNSLYIFLAFRQPAILANYTTLKYCTTPATKVDDCNFDLYKFVSDYNLHLSGVNWVWSQPDLYSRMKLYESNADQMITACQGVSGYGQPCPDPCLPVSSSTGTTASVRATTKRNNAGLKISFNSSLYLLVISLVFIAIKL